MGSSLISLGFVFMLITADQPIDAIQQEELAYQEDAFQQWWGTDIERRFDELPEKGAVPKFRVPYSGHDYPDTAGGTAAALRKYDMAFHRGRGLATNWEQVDTTSNKERTMVPGPIFGILRFSAERTPNWHGHCNGWTAAAIRHAEPRENVVRNGVTFTPADIKGLLAEIYMYNQTEFLGGVDEAINPGTLHMVIANWVGRGSHPIGMDTTLGREVWNYPIYAYATSHAKRSDNRVEVKMNVAYTISTRREVDRSEHQKKIRYFHYILQLDDNGQILGGTYFADSDRLDMLWTPLKPIPSGEEGNKEGNPYVDTKEVLSLWRASVPEELRNKWFNVDPTEEDLIRDAEPDPVLTSDDTPDAIATIDGTAGDDVLDNGAASVTEAADPELTDGDDPNSEGSADRRGRFRNRFAR